MQITELPFPVDLLEGSDAGRPGGAHLSAVIRDLANHTIHKGQRQSWDKLSPSERTRASMYFEMGFIWEEHFEWHWRKRMEKRLRRKIELSYQLHGLKSGGLWMTPDAVDEGLWELWEFKLTWKTVRRVEDLADDDSFWEWLVQIKGYLRALKMTICNLCAFFVNGDYSEPRVPRVKYLRLQFTQRELDENWQMIMNHKARMIREGRLAA